MTTPMSRTVAIGALLLLSACGGLRAPVSNLVSAPPPTPVVPAALTGTPTERLVGALEEQGCVLTVENRDAVLARAGLGLTDLATIIPALNAAGQAEAGGDGIIRILSDRCI